jgi:hypothetical protein
MKTLSTLVLSIFLMTSSSLSIADEAPANPNAGGTVKGAAVGGLGGAAVGHPIAGAAVGGVIGHHRRKKAEKKALRQQKEQTEAAGH